MAEAQVIIELSSTAEVKAKLVSDGQELEITPRVIMPGDIFTIRLSNVPVLQEAVYRENLQFLREENICLKSQLSALQAELESVKTQLRGS